jgi:hypothetical protein
LLIDPAKKTHTHTHTHTKVPDFVVAASNGRVFTSSQTKWVYSENSQQNQQRAVTTYLIYFIILGRYDTLCLLWQ